MPSAGSERALRRLVTDLARAAPEDVEAILGQLDGPRRQRVRALLSSYLAGDEPPPVRAPPPVREPPGPAGVSPWLAARLDPAASAHAGRAQGVRRKVDRYGRDLGLEFSMTAHALEALRASAAEAAPGPGSEPAATAPAPWLARVREAVSRRIGL